MINAQVKPSFSGLFLLLLAQLMVGVCIVGSKALLNDFSPLFILTVRFCIGFFVLLSLHFCFSKEKLAPLFKLKRIDWSFIIIQALCAGAFFNILLLLGLNYTSASVAGIITSALPAFVAIFSVVFLKERLSRQTLLCVCFAILGLIICNLSSFHQANFNSLTGDLIILLSLLPESAYYVLSKLHKNKLPVFLVSALMNGINIPIFIVLAIGFHLPMPGFISTMQLVLLIVVGFGSALFYVFWYLGYLHVPGTIAGLTTAFMPIATLAIAWIFLGETISMLQLVGMLMVIASIFFNVMKM